jgi:hypothetical protein
VRSTVKLFHTHKLTKHTHAHMIHPRINSQIYIHIYDVQVIQLEQVSVLFRDDDTTDVAKHTNTYMDAMPTRILHIYIYIYTYIHTHIQNVLVIQLEQISMLFAGDSTNDMAKQPQTHAYMQCPHVHYIYMYIYIHTHTVQVIQLEQMSLLFREGDSTNDVYIVRSGNIQLRTGIELPRYVLYT